MSRTIVAAARGEDAHDAIALATMLARTHDARVLIAGIYVLPIGQHAYGYEHAAREALRAELDTLSADVPADVEFDITMKAATSPIAGLHELAEATDAQAIVLGPSHVGGGTRALRGDVGLHLLHDAPCAIAVAPRGLAVAPVVPPDVVGVAWDDTDEAREALRLGADIAHRTHARLRLIHVVAPLPVTYDLPHVGDAKYLAARREVAEGSLREAAELLEIQPPPETLVVDGSPAEELVRAGADVGLLLAGSRAYGPVRRALLGSVTAHLLHHAPCPVLILPRGAGVPA